MLTASAFPFSRALPLCQLSSGGVGRIRTLSGDAAFCQRVREMGFCERVLVTKVSGTGTILCQVNGCRIALSHQAACQIVVEQVAALHRPVCACHLCDRAREALEAQAAAV